MRSLRRKRRWRLLGAASSSSSAKRTSASYRDCALCVHTPQSPHRHPLHRGGEERRSRHRKARHGKAAAKASAKAVRVICYCDTNADTLPLLHGNCYRSLCTAVGEEPGKKADKARKKKQQQPAPAFRCLNLARDRNLRDNHPCPCVRAPNASNGDHNFFFGRVDLNNNAQGGAKDKHVLLDDTCVRCCVVSTLPPPRLFCFDKAAARPPAPAASADCDSCCSDSLACCSSSPAEDGDGHGDGLRRSFSQSRFPLPVFLRNPKALQRASTLAPSVARSPVVAAPPPVALPGVPGVPGPPPVPAARSTAPQSAGGVVSNPLYQEAPRPRPLPPLPEGSSEDCAPSPPQPPQHPEEPAPDFDDEPETDATDDGPADEGDDDEDYGDEERKALLGRGGARADSVASTSLTIGPGDALSPGYFLECDGVFKNLTQLDVSENAIEVLDLSALSKLQTLQCSRNSLRELSVNGRHLTSLIAGNNQLRTLNATPTPLQLEHLDVSYNCLASLPAWVGGCSRLRALFASHNELTAVPQQMLSGQLPHLHTLQLSYNQLQQLPPASGRLPLALHHLFLQSNRLSSLPAHLFAVATRLRVLNVSNNRLEELPPPAALQDSDGDRGSPLDKLYLTANCLGDAALRALAAFRRLRTLHAAYNHLSLLPDSCVASWPDLEELVLSGNTLRNLPENIVQLRHLRVLRVHSNQLRNSPCFARMTSLKVLDLSHNQLDRVSLATLAPPQLQFLDLSCNSRLHVDPRQFSVYRSQRQGGPATISLVDVSGLNRSSLPTAPPARTPPTPWAVGFSETPGLRERLYISQLRLPAFCSSEGLFGLFDGGGEGSLPAALVKAVPRILLEERAVAETAADYLKYTLLSAHRELREHGQKQGACATLVHVSPRGARYVLRVASVGEAKAILARTDGPMTLTREQTTGSSRHPLESAVRSQLGCSALFPLVLPDPHVVELELRESDDFLVLANQRLWEVVSEREAVQEVRAASSPLLAAKRLQDVAQSYGCEDNVSVLVLRLGALTASVQAHGQANCVVTDLSSTLRSHRHTLPDVADDSISPCSCCAPCCRCRHDRSSPSGQSDQASCESRPAAPAMALAPHMTLAPQPAPRRPTGTLSSGTGIFKSVRCRVDNGYNSHRGGSGGSGCSDSGGDTSGSGASGSGSDRSHLSEEQFRCWEYMLEQNTQLLFDKELDTLSRAFTRTGPSRPMAMPVHAARGLGGRALSSSSPHLAHAGAGVAAGLGAAPTLPAVAAQPAPFLSRHFGSARSLSTSLTPASRRLGPSGMGLGFGASASRPMQLLHTGPNAAYFGSLQRLMPYNLEYDFDVIHERAESRSGRSVNGHSISSLADRGDQDSLEQDGRMRKYWDVATTEL